MKRSSGKIIFSFLLAPLIFFSLNLQAYAQSSNDDLSPKTQQYIDNLNEVKQAQNSGATPADLPANEPAQGTSAWTFVFYGFLSGVAYAFWRWVKRLRNRD